jgi:hypothetical protein
MRESKPPRIGTEHESSLHRALKVRYAGSAERTETLRGGYVCDGISETGELIEVQLGSFGALKTKIPELLKLGKVRIVHPVIVKKTIELYDPGGTLLYRRKSPRKGTPWDLFKVLIYAPELALSPGLIIELTLVEATERRVRDGRGSWRRRGDSIADRALTACRGSILLAAREDYSRFIPFAAGEEFTARELGKRAGINPVIARKTLYTLTRLGLVERTGKRGRAWTYTGMSLPRKRLGRQSPKRARTKKERPSAAPVQNRSAKYVKKNPGV